MEENIRGFQYEIYVFIVFEGQVPYRRRKIYEKVKG
mgnify:FL=1